MNVILISGDCGWLTALLSARTVEELPLFPSAASPVPSPVGGSLVKYRHQLTGEENHCEPFH